MGEITEGTVVGQGVGVRISWERLGAFNRTCLGVSAGKRDLIGFLSGLQWLSQASRSQETAATPGAGVGGSYMRFDAWDGCLGWQVLGRGEKGFVQENSQEQQQSSACRQAQSSVLDKADPERLEIQPASWF